MSLTGHSKVHVNSLNEFLDIDSKVEENEFDDVVITFGSAC